MNADYVVDCMNDLLDSLIQKDYDKVSDIASEVRSMAQVEVDELDAWMEEEAKHQEDIEAGRLEMTYDDNYIFDGDDWGQI